MPSLFTHLESSIRFRPLKWMMAALLCYSAQGATHVSAGGKYRKNLHFPNYRQYDFADASQLSDETRLAMRVTGGELLFAEERVLSGGRETGLTVSALTLRTGKLHTAPPSEWESASPVGTHVDSPFHVRPINAGYTGQVSYAAQSVFDTGIETPGKGAEILRFWEEPPVVQKGRMRTVHTVIGVPERAYYSVSGNMIGCRAQVPFAGESGVLDSGTRDVYGDCEPRDDSRALFQNVELRSNGRVVAMAADLGSAEHNRPVPPELESNTVQPGLAVNSPKAISVAPYLGSGNRQTFTFTASDMEGAPVLRTRGF